MPVIGIGHINLRTGRAMMDALRPAHVTGTIDQVAFVCTGFVETQTRLNTLGVPFTSGEIPLTGRRQIFLVDPAGNRLELSSATDEAAA